MDAASREARRISAGELPTDARKRLEELSRSGRFTSFLTPRALAVAADARIEPLGQVVGFSSGDAIAGVTHTTRREQGRARFGVPRWLEHSGHVSAWATIRRHARRRLADQAKLVGADAVIGVTARREEHTNADELHVLQLELLGTAVRMPALRRGRDADPVLTLASAQEVWALLRAGVEPVGIAGGYANVATRPGTATVRAAMSTRNAELADPTRAFYEARHLAMKRLVTDARGIDAGGVLGVSLEDRHESGTRDLPGLFVEVHLLGNAVRPRRRDGLGAKPVVRVGGAGRG